MSTQLVSIESPYNSLNPWTLRRNIQYAVMANSHAASIGDATWTPHICNTQVVRYGFLSYVGDSTAAIVTKLFGPGANKYGIGRERTLEITNNIRRTKIDKVVCYTDFGVSSGMQSAIDAANDANVTVEMRKLPDGWLKEVFGQSLTSTVLPVVNDLFWFGIVAYGLWTMA